MAARLTDDYSVHTSQEWEDLARSLERDGLWHSAMQAWRKAMSSSAEGSRRGRYETEAERCLREAQR